MVTPNDVFEHFCNDIGWIIKIGASGTIYLDSLHLPVLKINPMVIWHEFLWVPVVTLVAHSQGPRKTLGPGLLF